MKIVIIDRETSLSDGMSTISIEHVDIFDFFRVVNLQTIQEANLFIVTDGEEGKFRVMKDCMSGVDKVLPLDQLGMYINRWYNANIR